MKKIVFLTGLCILAGCAAPKSGMQLNDLRKDAYLRTERSLPFDTFAKVQMALFKHKAACGGDIEFKLNPRNASYAIITKKPSPAADWNHTIVLDLVLMEGRPIKASAYSYYAGTEAQIQQMFDAVTRPQVCPK